MMAVSHLLIALLVSRLYPLSGSERFEIVEVFEFGGEWGDHAIAAWVAVRYATLPHAARRLCRIQSMPQLRVPFHSCLWHQYWTHWLGPSERSVPAVYEGQRCCSVGGIKLAE